MNAQELIDRLNKLPDKKIPVAVEMAEGLMEIMSAEVGLGGEFKCFVVVIPMHKSKV